MAESVANRLKAARRIEAILIEELEDAGLVIVRIDGVPHALIGDCPAAQSGACINDVEPFALDAMAERIAREAADV